MADFLFQLSLEIPKEFGNAFAENLEPHFDSVFWTAQEEASIADVQGYSEEQPDDAAVQMAIKLTAEALDLSPPEFSIEKIPVRDWVLDNIKQFPPIHAGRFFVHSAEYDDPIPHIQIGLRVPAGAAFGSGEHGSTKGCLLALDKMDHLPVRRALDMGCGSGILAIAMAKRWHIPVVASDIDPISTEVCQKNAEINGVARFVRSLCAPGYNHPEVAAQRYDVIVSNILARPLARMAKDLGRYLNHGGYAVLSGLLHSDANRIIAAHANQGLHLESRVRQGEWGTLVMKKK